MDLPAASAPPAADGAPLSSHSASGSSQPANSDLKRKRSPEGSAHASPTQSGPPATKRATNHLQINYLARQFEDDLPLVSTDDTMPAILHLLGEYQGVLDRHESMAGNLGARPLGPILIKRFERLFDGPPRVIKGHSKDGGVTNVTWLDVVEFARSKPEQFTLGQMSEGVRVCQFYTKQSRVQISEEDWVLINSGIPQKMIPPQPIMEDEEKELGTLEILEKSLASIFHLADQVAARSRQLNHKLKGRKQAIIDRRATSPSISIRSSSPSALAYLNGTANGTAALATTAPSGFTAVNATPRPSSTNGDKPHTTSGASSATTRAELLSKFHTLADRRASNGGFNGDLRFGTPRAGTAGVSMGTPGFSPSQSHVSGGVYGQSPSYPLGRSDAVTSTPTAPRPPRLRQPQNDDDAQPYRAVMVAKMEALPKGERVIPPCDRCRRLHMDCIKNLTACLGCTKKHAKCSWWEVKASEMEADGDEGSIASGADAQAPNGTRSTEHHANHDAISETSTGAPAQNDDSATALSTLGQLGMGALERYAAAGELEMQQPAATVDSNVTTGSGGDGRMDTADETNGVREEHRGSADVDMRDAREVEASLDKVDV